MGTSRVRSGIVDVEGLRELNRALKELGPQFPKEMRAVNKKAAEEVSGEARAAALAQGGVAAKSASSIKVSAGAMSAGLAVGGSTAPWAVGAEFGGGGRPTTQQFKPWRGNGSNAGYFVYPTIRENADEIESTYREGLDELLERVGLIAHG